MMWSGQQGQFARGPHALRRGRVSDGTVPTRAGRPSRRLGGRLARPLGRECREPGTRRRSTSRTGGAPGACRGGEGDKGRTLIPNLRGAEMAGYRLFKATYRGRDGTTKKSAKW